MFGWACVRVKHRKMAMLLRPFLLCACVLCACVFVYCVHVYCALCMRAHVCLVLYMTYSAKFFLIMIYLVQMFIMYCIWIDIINQSSARKWKTSLQYIPYKKQITINKVMKYQINYSACITCFYISVHLNSAIHRDSANH